MEFMIKYEFDDDLGLIVGIDGIDFVLLIASFYRVEHLIQCLTSQLFIGSVKITN